MGPHASTEHRAGRHRRVAAGRGRAGRPDRLAAICAFAALLCAAVAGAAPARASLPAAVARSPISSISVAPSRGQQVVAGTSTAFAVRVLVVRGFRGSVTVEVRGLPAGAAATITPLARRGEARVDISTLVTTPPGTYRTQFVAIPSNGGAARAKAVNLTVLPGATPPPTQPPPTAPPPPPTQPPVTSTTAAQVRFAIAPDSLYMNVDPGTSASTGIRIAVEGRLSTSVTYAASGLPSGVSASFTPNPATDNAVLTVSASSTAATGSYPITITATSSGQVQATAIVLTVRTSTDFALVVDGQAKSVAPGGTVTYALTASPASDALGAVTYTVSNLPPGSAAAFTPNPAVGSTSLAITTSATTPVGTYSITITGTRGSVVRTGSVQLTVGSVAGFGLAAQPTSATVARGGAVTFRVTVTPGSYSGTVAISVGGVPVNASSTSTVVGVGLVDVTVTTTASTPVGVAVITVTGTGGTLTASVQVTLTVT